jgi:hypothetical protein
MAALGLVFAIASLSAAVEPPSVTVLVPVVGSIAGISGLWKTDVELRNDTAEDAVVALSLPTAPDQPTIILTMPPGGVQRFNDVVSEAFGLETALSPLRVQTLGRRSVQVSVSVYAARGSGLTRPEPIPVSYSDAYYPVQSLAGLSFSDNFRTNVGLVNLAETSASFTLALQRMPGRNLAIARVIIPANSLWHQAVQTLFPLITKGDDFTVVIETGSRDTYAYASVIDNTTSDARFIQPSIGAPMAQDAVREPQ